MSDVLTAADRGPAAPDVTRDDREELAGRLVASLVAAAEVFTVHLGTELGLYEHLRAGWSRPAELAQRTGSDARYVREWLEQQAVTAIVEVEDPTAAPEARRYRLSEAHAEVLLHDSSPYFAGAVGEFAASLGRVIDDLTAAIRTGAGVPYAAYGVHHAIAAFNRPAVVNEMASVWLPAGPDHDRLRALPAPRILDLGAGTGQTTVELARAYPHATVRGVDLDADSVAAAVERASREGVADRVSFSHADALSFDTDDRFDLVVCFEVLHDTGDPAGVLRNARRLLAPGGAVLIADDKGSETFEAPGDEFQRLLHAFSVLHCVPATRAEHHVEAHGTVVRPSDVGRWATTAGFTGLERLPVEHEMWWFFRATP